MKKLALVALLALCAGMTTQVEARRHFRQTEVKNDTRRRENITAHFTFYYYDGKTSKHKLTVKSHDDEIERRNVKKAVISIDKQEFEINLPQEKGHRDFDIEIEGNKTDGYRLDLEGRAKGLTIKKIK